MVNEVAAANTQEVPNHTILSGAETKQSRIE